MFRITYGQAEPGSATLQAFTPDGAPLELIGFEDASVVALRAGPAFGITGLETRVRAVSKSHYR
jgi:hypothetical protein